SPPAVPDQQELGNGSVLAGRLRCLSELTRSEKKAELGTLHCFPLEAPPETLNMKTGCLFHTFTVPFPGLCSLSRNCPMRDYAPGVPHYTLLSSLLQSHR